MLFICDLSVLGDTNSAPAISVVVSRPASNRSTVSSRWLRSQPGNSTTSRLTLMSGFPSAGPPEMREKRRKAGSHGVGASDLLQPGRDVEVTQMGIIATVAADDLVYGGGAVFHQALREAGRLEPEARSASVARLTGGRDCPGSPVRAGARIAGMASTGREVSAV